MLSVGVLVDLIWQPSAGGHVKCWEQFAEAATKLSDELDLTLHFLGDHHYVVEQTHNVRYIIHRPQFSTERISWLGNVPGHTDLCPYNASLVPYLQRCDVVHSTHPLFAFGKTALTYCQKHAKPLVASIHTATPQYTEIYIEQLIHRILRQRDLCHYLIEHLRLPLKYRNLMQERQKKYWQNCQHVLASRSDDLKQLSDILPSQRVSFLRRGINKDRFNLSHNNKQQLERDYGIPANRFLVLFVGRLDDCKNVMTFAQSVQLLIQRGLSVHAVVVGKGERDAAILSLLGDSVSMLGSIDHTRLGTIFASSDLFVFPSETEIVGNVVVEAQASGLPVLVSKKGGAKEILKASGWDGFIVEDNRPESWADLIESLVRDPQKLEQMGQAAHQHIQAEWPSWTDVLREDLLPIWRSLSQAATVPSEQETQPSHFSP